MEFGHVTHAKSRWRRFQRQDEGASWPSTASRYVGRLEITFMNSSDYIEVHGICTSILVASTGNRVRRMLKIHVSCQCLCFEVSNYATPQMNHLFSPPVISNPTLPSPASFRRISSVKGSSISVLTCSAMFCP